MTYEQALCYIHARPKLPSAGSLQRIGPLLDRVGHPERELSFVHITGTNGKGSAAAMLARAFYLDGRRTGLFISPFVLDFRERMQIDGQMIPQAELTELVEQTAPEVEALAKEGHLVSEFELDTVLALLWFYRRRCSVVVLEVGIGGAHDATNCIGRPLLSVIMGIGLDHQQILGDTLEKIAAEKAGIIKGNPAVSYPLQAPEVTAVLMERCAVTGGVLHQPNPAGVDILQQGLMGSRFVYGGEEYALSLLGQHQVYNAVTVIESARLLGIGGRAVREALATVHFPGRMELVRQAPPLILDGAHNAHGMAALAQSLAALESEGITAMVGMLQDKDRAEALALLAPHCGRIVAVGVDNPRSAPAGETARLASPYCSETVVCEDWQNGLEQVLAADTPVLICGSLYLVSDCRRRLAEMGLIEQA